MKIERMCTQADIISNLTKAGNYAGIDQLKKLALHIKEKINLVSLKEGLEIPSYEIKIEKDFYCIYKLVSRFNEDANKWEVIEKEVIEKISINEIAEDR